MSSNILVNVTALERVMESKKWTVAMTATEAGISQQTLRFILRGMGTSKKIILALAAALDCNFRDLVLEAPETEPQVTG